jgi:AbrB family looped-hinge helix DNA binding protein
MAEEPVSSKNQIVIPKEAREALGIKPGDKVLVIVHRGQVTLMKRPSKYHEAIRGIARNLCRSGATLLVTNDASLRRINAFETLLFDGLL